MRDGPNVMVYQIQIPVNIKKLIIKQIVKGSKEDRWTVGQPRSLCL
jgi:hypothetical protein